MNAEGYMMNRICTLLAQLNKGLSYIKCMQNSWGENSDVLQNYDLANLRKEATLKI